MECLIIFMREMSASNPIFCTIKVVGSNSIHFEHDSGFETSSVKTLHCTHDSSAHNAAAIDISYIALLPERCLIYRYALRALSAKTLKNSEDIVFASVVHRFHTTTRQKSLGNLAFCLFHQTSI